MVRVENLPPRRRPIGQARRSPQSAAAKNPAAQHAEEVYLVTEGAAPPERVIDLVASWRRSLSEHGVDPLRSESPRILSFDELKNLRGPIDDLIHAAQDEIERLYGIVRAAGYTLLFCDTSGIAVEHRGDKSDAGRYRHWGTWLGGMWSEAVEGTNGIGTCIAEERPVTVHRTQHFRSRHIDLSCSGAPIFDINGRLQAVLDVSAIDPDLSERAHALTGGLTVASARAIEERFFRERFRQDWVIATCLPDDTGGGLLLAVDRDHRIIAADRTARRALMLDDAKLDRGVSLWSLFAPDPAAFRGIDRFGVSSLRTADGSEAWPVLITPPQRPGAARTSADGALHTQPRLNSLRGLHHHPLLQSKSHGGLSSRAMRSVREYVDVHLDEPITLATLASIVGSSVFHFAHEFKYTTGVTPHQYLIERRVNHARAMLAETDLPIANIAIAAGFFDQSHLTRHFDRLIGMTPRQFRSTQR